MYLRAVTRSLLHATILGRQKNPAACVWSLGTGFAAGPQRPESFGAVLGPTYVGA